MTEKKMGNNAGIGITGKNIIRHIVITMAVIVMLMSLYSATYAYHALSNAKMYVKGSEEVQVKKTYREILFDGKGEDSLFIFYGGALVDEVAYSELAYRIAESGTDVAIVRMPLDMAILAFNRADNVRKRLKYDHYYIGGHSMGGAFCTVNAAKNQEAYDGVILLGAYASSDLSDSDLRMLSIYGENDQVLSRKSYEESKVKNPKDTIEFVIPGGNHAAFGDYGYQKGDGELTIDGELQIELTVEQIEQFIDK